jgi:hypothetical protein
MFGSFTSLFSGASTGQDKEKEKNSLDSFFQSSKLTSDFQDGSHKESAQSLIPLLTETSKRQKAPVSCKVPLWSHQEAMLARCLEIEANPAYAQAIYKNAGRYWSKDNMNNIPPVKIGVLNDPPGCGKTYTILSLIACDKQRKGLNIICVPQNIFAQWQHALETMFDSTKVSYKCINNYADVTGFYGDPNVFKQYSILLLNDAYLETLTTTLNDTKTTVHRLIIDEIDSVQNRLYTPIHAEHVWLISASFVHKETEAVGPYKFQSVDIPRIFCRCDSRFVSKQIRLPTPISTVLSCEDNEIQLFRGVVSTQALTGLNAMNEKPLRKELGFLNSMSLPEVAAKYVERLRQESEKLEQYEEDEKECTNPTLKKEYALVIAKLQGLRQKANVIEERLSRYTPSAKTKWSMFESEIIPKIGSETKWLLFNDNAETLYRIERLLQEKSISSRMLDGGNVDEVDRTLQEYSRGSLQVLLLNSKLEGAGMNLEQTTHLLFLHATHERLVEQVVGRAQRFGRPGPLHIYGLFHLNEQEDIASGSLKDLTSIASAE